MESIISDDSVKSAKAANMAPLAENLLLGRTCDACCWRRRTDRAENGRLVLVAEVCMQRGRAAPWERTCGEWANVRHYFAHP